MMLPLHIVEPLGFYCAALPENGGKRGIHGEGGHQQKNAKYQDLFQEALHQNWK